MDDLDSISRQVVEDVADSLAVPGRDKQRSLGGSVCEAGIRQKPKIAAVASRKLEHSIEWGCGVDF